MFRWVRHRGWLAAATFALLWHAFAPLSAPLLAQARAAWLQTPPELAAICHGAGPAAAAADGSGSSVPGSDHCPWCRVGGADTALPPPQFSLALAGARHETPPAAPAPRHPAPTYRPDHARGPPALSSAS